MFRVVTVLLCLFMGGCWQSDENQSLLTRIPDMINYLCPGSNVCSNNRSFETSDDVSFTPGTESCCAECSCLATCTNTNNCCYPNVISFEKNVDVNDIRNDRSCLYSLIPQPSADHHLYQSFLMVSSVLRPDTVGVSNVPCGDMKVAPWGSFYPVYSAKSKQIYKNIECAREDGEDSDTILWDAVIKCEYLQRDQVLIMLENGQDTRSILESCRINFIFPGDFDVLQSLKCFTNLIDTCTESHDFNLPEGVNVSQDEIRKLCTKSGIVSPYRALKMYANVFCHICNEETFYRQDYCSKYSRDFNVKGGNEDGFRALIDDKFITENIDTGDTSNQVSHIACSAREEDKCRPILCPTGQLRDRTSKCVYPTKIWYNQNYVVNVNLTLYKTINVSEVFNIKYGYQYSTSLPSLESAWLKRWDIDSVYFRVIDVPYVSNNFIISLHRLLSKVKPDVIITNIKKMIGQAWSLRSRNVTEILTSSNFSIRTDLLKDYNEIKPDNFYNLTENFKIDTYKLAYNRIGSGKKLYPVTRLYMCDQVELGPSEFELSNENDIIHNCATKRLMFDSQFTLVKSPIVGQYRARICLDESRLYRRTTIEDFGTIPKPNIYCIGLASMLFIFLHQNFYQL